MLEHKLNAAIKIILDLYWLQSRFVLVLLQMLLKIFAEIS
jgi:hypothetical protein